MSEAAAEEELEYQTSVRVRRVIPERWYGPKDLANMAGITYRQVQYWDTTGFIVAGRKGRFRRYDRYEVLLLLVVQYLRKRGRSIQWMRRLAPSLRRAIERAGAHVFERTFIVDQCGAFVWAWGSIEIPEIPEVAVEPCLVIDMHQILIEMNPSYLVREERMIHEAPPVEVEL